MDMDKSDSGNRGGIGLTKDEEKRVTQAFRKFSRRQTGTNYIKRELKWVDMDMGEDIE